LWTSIGISLARMAPRAGRYGPGRDRRAGPRIRLPRDHERG
jgi:hypothetical protein